MKKNAIALSLVSATMLLSSCSLIEGVFKAGMGVGIAIVVVIIAIVIFVISKLFGGRKG